MIGSGSASRFFGGPTRIRIRIEMIWTRNTVYKSIFPLLYLSTLFYLSVTLSCYLTFFYRICTSSASHWLATNRVISVAALPDIYL
jgi:hypothetical protein